MPLPGATDLRVVSVRDITNRRRVLDRAEHDQRRLAGLLDITQRAPLLTENELFGAALKLLELLTGSASAYGFLALPEARSRALRHAAGAVPTPRRSTCWRNGAGRQSPGLHCSIA